MFTGTLIDDLMATVERVEQKAQEKEMAEIEAFMASLPEVRSYDSAFFGRA